MKRKIFSFAAVTLLVVTPPVFSQEPTVTYQQIEAADYNPAELKAHLQPNDPMRISSLILLGHLAAQEGNESQAEVYLKQAATEAQRHPEHLGDAVNALSALGSLYNGQNKFTAAIGVLTRALPLISQLPTAYAPIFADIHHAYGYALFEVGHLEEAKAMLEKSLTYDAHCEECQNILKQISQTAQSVDYLSSLDKTVIRWNDETHLIRVYLGDGYGLKDWKPQLVAMARNAFVQWQKATGNHFEFQFVGTAPEADVRILWQEPPGLDHGEVSTGVSVQDMVGPYLTHNDIQVSLHDETGSPIVPDEVYSTLLHEIGHMLGINGHSPFPSDVMSTDSTSNVISSRDITTLKAVYRLRPNFTNPRGMTLAQYRERQNK